jgi:hypothetical protein
MRFWVGAAVALALSAMFASSAAAQSLPDTDEVQQVIERFELARGAGDVDGALAQLADTAVITVQSQSMTRSFSGDAQLRGYMQSIGAHFQTVMRSRPMVQGRSITWTERDQVGNQSLDTTVVAVVSAGHIVSLIYHDTNPAGTSGRLGATQATHGQPLQVPSGAWAASLAGLGLGLIGLVFGRPRRKASQSELDGRLLVALRREHQLDDGEELAA